MKKTALRLKGGGGGGIVSASSQCNPPFVDSWRLALQQRGAAALIAEEKAI